MSFDLKTEAQEVARIGYADPVFFLRFFLPEWFPDHIPWFHRGILALLTGRTDFLLKYGDLDLILEHFVWKESEDGPEHPIFKIASDGTISMVVSNFTLIKMPRGFSKTTLLNGYNVWAVVYQVRKFIVYISESGTHAEMQLKAVKGQLEGNDKIQTVFGSLVPDQRTGKKWTETMIETTTGVVLVARGRGAQIRGLNVNGQRPDFILMDDVEDKESVQTDVQRDKVKKWAYNDVFPALPHRDPTAGLCALGTLLHSDALLQTFEKDPQFHSITFSCLDRRGRPLWPEHMPMEMIEKKRRSAAAIGELSGFYMEYFNQLRNEDASKFKESYIIHEPLPSPDEVPFRAIACDPAISEKPGASHFTIAVVGMSKKGLIWVLDVWGGVGIHPRQQVDQYFAYWMKWKPQYAGVESIGYQKALVHLLREEMFRKKVYFEITEVKGHDKSKDDRILGILAPRYAAGYVRHRTRFPDLEAQLLDFPNGGKDYPDAVAMAVALLDPYAAQAADPDLDLGDDEYPPLEEEMAGDWRGI